ncbi:hypothetical protein [Bradyrhizobium vignae]|uniref:hypothetical protein n=1 Tax=Bradyrhizobium vignae TaxID=1549949 RepID=UPI00100C2A36|nr:hypothetical protein [Bradyrhizobium vignae]RXG85630.1 hypothetical protein EAV90_35000 [Bradyrhizobium vignae]
MDFGGGAKRDIAVHEAGHAVARVLSIGRVGITNENAIRWIEMEEGTPHCSVFELPLNMPGLKEFGEREGIREGTRWTVEQWRKLFSYMGIDPLEWASVRVFELTAGAAAQAKFIDASFHLVWHDYGCSDDRQNVIETCQRTGLNGSEATRLFAEQAEQACIAMDNTDVWRAVLALAERLPTTGRMPGSTVISIVQNALRAL